MKYYGSKPCWNLSWLREDLESEIINYAVECLVPAHLDEVKKRKDNLVPKTMKAVKERLETEINNLNNQVDEFERKAEAHKTNAKTCKTTVEAMRILRELDPDNPQWADLQC